MAERAVTLDIGINGAFATRRWDDPENVIGLVSEWGYPYFSVCADCLDPNMSGRFGEEGSLEKRAERYREAAEQRGVVLWDYYTGMITHRTHGLASFYADEVDAMKSWMLGSMKLCELMGVERLGGHLDAIPVELFEDQEAYQQRGDRVIGHFRELSASARQRGVTLYNEHMYIPSELPWTLSTAEEFLVKVNRDNPNGPIRLTGDVGHHAGQSYRQWGYTQEDADYIRWLERFAAQTEIIHVQQTTPDASHHWPFTDEFNQKGHIQIEEIIKAIQYAFAHYDEQPVASFVSPVDKIVLIFEYIPGSTQSEAMVLDAAQKTVEYLREFIPEGGLKLIGERRA